MKPILIFGAGQVAEVFAAYIGHDNVAAFVVDGGYQTTDVLRGKPVVLSERVESAYPPSQCAFIVGMSFKGLNKPRAAKFAEMRARGYDSVVSTSTRSTYCVGSTVGAGTMVMDENTIQPYASIGENCILWSGNHIGHHTRIGNHVFIASHAVISGACEIGDYSFIGVNATIRDGVKIGKRNIIGAGALILHDTPDDAVYKADATPRSKVTSDRLRF